MTVLDARTSRQAEGGASFSLSHRLFRAAWGVAWLILARWTPPPMHPWRAFVLRLFGSRIGKGARVYASARIWYPPHLHMADFATLGPRTLCYNQARIMIGARAVVSQGAHLCAGTHDVSDPDFQLVTRPITVADRAWVAAEAFVGPGVKVGEGAVLGARGVAMRDLDPWTIYSGNPAMPLRHRRLRRSGGVDQEGSEK